MTTFRESDSAYFQSIGQKSKDLVFGYIRGIYIDIPAEIYNICLLFFSKRESFVLHGENIRIDRNELICIDCQGGSGYGAVEISESFGIRYRWKIKIVRNNKGGIELGICDSTEYLNQSFVYGGYEGEFYALQFGCKISKNDIKMVSIYNLLKTGDIIYMECDTTQKTLKYSLDEEEIVFDNIDYSKIYRLSVAMKNEQNSVELLSFESSQYCMVILELYLRNACF